MRDTIFFYDMNRQLQYVNPAFETLTGYTTKELYEKNFINYIHPDDETRMIKLWEELFQGNAFAGKEFRIITKDGQIKWCLSSWSPLFDEKGNQIGAQGRETDITESKRSEEEYRTIVRTAINGFWIVDMQGRFLDVNDAYCRLIGYSRDELLTMKISDVEAVERPEETAQRIQKIMEVGGDRFETRHKCKDGRIIDIEVSVNYMEIGGRRMFVFLRDITERKQAEEALRKSEEITKQLAKENAIMAEIGRIVSSTLNIEEVYERFAEEVRKLIPFDRIAINIINPRRQHRSLSLMLRELKLQAAKLGIFSL